MQPNQNTLKNLMKKIYKSVTSLALGILLMNSTNAQNSNVNANSEAAPISTPSAGIVLPSPNALFDIQFSFLPEDSVPTVSIAGAGIVAGEIWVSKWNGNGIYRFTPGGSYIDSFVIAGVTGTRAITFDGTNAWVSYNGTTVKKINATTHAVLATITPPALTGSANTNIRWITYDPTANSGAGGFWIGNYDTDILQISMTGALLNTISAGTHGLTGMYGASFDNLSPGGPFVWVNNQGDPTGGASTAVIVQLDATGNLTGVQHDVDADFGSAGGVAGGICVGQLPGLPNSTILAVDQGTATVAYELTVTGLKKNDFASQLSIQPNPSTGLFTIVNKSKINNADVTITNTKGEVVYTTHINNFTSEKIDARHLSKGVYMVTISNEIGKSTKSMIIQ